MLVVFIFAGVVFLLTLLTFVPGLQAKFIKEYERHISESKRERIRAVNVREDPEEYIRRDFGNKRKALLLGSFMVAALGAASVYSGSIKEKLTTVERPSFGEGAVDMEIVAELQEETEGLTLNIGEKTPTDEEVEAFFQAEYAEAEPLILGENASWYHVDKDLNLITGMADGVDMEWTIGTDLINIAGELSDDIPAEGSSAELSVEMTYGEYSKTFTIEVTLWPLPKQTTLQEELESYVNSEIEAQDQDTVSLPEEYKETALSYSSPKNDTFAVLAVVVAVASVLLWKNGDSKLEDSYKKRNQQLLSDYPRIVSKLSILFSAGLTIPAAWERMVKNYEEELLGGAPRSAGFEEMRLTAQEIKNTGLREGVFERFGSRCNSYSYRKLGSILESSMKKGTIRLSTYMEQEASQAFEMRKQAADKMGEEAGTKLLFPTMVMFALVLVMVVVPAWLGMNM